MGCAIMLAQTSISTGILVEEHAAPPRHGKAAIRGGISVSAAGLKTGDVWSYTAVSRHIEKVCSRKMAPAIFLGLGHKKVGRPKSNLINCFR